ncbi:MAG: metallophosphoesterase [Saprospiraceae bacterium]|nr:metallophosphoesterase [Saprospiraceae bacterium]
MRNPSILFLATVSLVLLLIDFYVFWALRWWIIQNGMSSKTFSRIYWSMTVVAFVIFYASAYYGRNFAGQPYSAYLGAFAFILLVSKLFCAVFLLITDFIRVVGYIQEKVMSKPAYMSSRSKFLHSIAAGMAILPFTTFWYGILRNPYRYKLHKVKIPISNLPKGLEGFKIVQVSDIHSGSFTFKEPIQNGIDMINQCQADVICFTGDLVNTVANEIEPYIDMFKSIKAKHGVYSIMGNHDYGDYKRWDTPEEKQANAELFIDQHRKLGWKLLLNENRVIEHQGEKLAIIGVENYSASPRFAKYGDLNKAFMGVEESIPFKLLLSHDPSHWDDQVVKSFKNIDLTLSGHTHGFQFGIEIPGWIKWSPIEYAYKQWAGLYQESNQYLYVNRGFGFLGYPGRVGILPEITEITLTGVTV